VNALKNSEIFYAPYSSDKVLLFIVYNQEIMINIIVFINLELRSGFQNFLCNVVWFQSNKLLAIANETLPVNGY